MKTRFPRNCGFGLVELFIVVLLIVAMAAFALSTRASGLQGTRLSRAERIFADQMKLARQEALTRNRSVEVRFLRYADPEMPGEQAGASASGHFRAIQLLEILDNGSMVPLDKPHSLPQGIVMGDGEHSTLLSHPDLQPRRTPSDQAGDPGLPRGIDWSYDYAAFRFHPDGGTNLNSTNGVIWCTTLRRLVDRSNGTDLPANFVTVQLDPVAGSLRLFRPSVR